MTELLSQCRDHGVVAGGCYSAVPALLIGGPCRGGAAWDAVMHARPNGVPGTVRAEWMRAAPRFVCCGSPPPSDEDLVLLLVALLASLAWLLSR